MAEYIDKNKAINAVFEAFADGRSAYIALEAIPAEDAQPVRHGRWIEDCAGAAVCSACNEYAFETSTHHLCGWFPRYCPNCGAKMEEDDG